MYSPKGQTAHCFCCWLFSKAGGKWADPCSGFSNYRKDIEKIEMHEKSTTHRQAEKEFLMTIYRINQDRTVVAELLNAKRELIDKNRKILVRLIDTAHLLARQGLPFRGHREHGAPDTNERNFLETLKYLARYDAITEQHLTNPGSRVTYLSHHSQNEFISGLASETLHYYRVCQSCQTFFGDS